MALGKNIYELRTAKNLSQGDLADLLDVSRQSVSKWETDAAIPDLDKLIKMCDVFGVTLDELTGRTPQEKEGTTVTVVEKSSTLTPQKIVGYILLATTLIATILLFALADDVETFYIPLPILISTLVCSLICLCVKKHAGYWCTWATLAPICILSFHIVGLPILTRAGIMQIIVYIVMAFIQQTDSYGLSSLDFHHRRVLRRPRFRYGSIIITAICHRSPQVVILQPFPRATPSAIKVEGIVPRFCGSQAHHLAITATYLLKVYSIVNESRGFYNPFTYKAREMRF